MGGRPLAGAPSTWLTGRQQAIAGIHMQADPVPGGAEYVQGRAPRIDFFDKAKVVKRTSGPARRPGLLQGRAGHQRVGSAGPAGRTATSSSPAAPGVGIVRIDAPRRRRAGDARPDQGRHLTDAAAFAEARAKVVKLDTRAYTLAAAVWQGTPPAHAPSQGGPALGRAGP